MSQEARLLGWYLPFHKVEVVPMVFNLCSQGSQENEEGLWMWGLWQGKFTEIPPEQLCSWTFYVLGVH